MSIHIVNADFDSGPVVSQCKVLLLPGDSIDTLKLRVRTREREFLVETLAGMARGHIALVHEAG